MRLGVVLFILLFSEALFAQKQKQDSILMLQEVAVQGTFEKQFLAGNNIIMPKQNILDFHSGDNISEVLKHNSSIYFKEYGNGMLTTIAFRGTSASQTSVLWHNFNINSFTLGQTDFSLLPSQAIEEISIIPGSGSSMGGNGAFGGAVLLENPLDFNSRQKVSISQQVGSFNHFNSHLNASGSNGQWAYDTRLYWQKAKNDFTVLQTGETQENAAFKSYGLNQSIGYKFNEAEKIKLAIWYHDNFREIQPPIGSNRDINQQSDQSLRTHLNFEKQGKKSTLNVGTGYFMDELDYQLNQAVSYYLVNRSESFADYKYIVANAHNVKLSARYNYIEAQNQNYAEGVAIEQRYSLGILFKGPLGEKTNYSAHLRQQLVPGVKIPVSPYAGISTEIYSEQNHALNLKLNSSYNYRLPTLNDRFWNEVGNPELRSETGWNKEISIDSKDKWGSVKSNISVTAYHNTVDNWIQWVPDENNQWRPRNIKKVVAQGIETQLDIIVPIQNEVQVNLNSQYSYTQSIVQQSESNPNEIGKQLIYTPRHKANSSASLKWKNISINSFLQWTGKVYTTNSNSEVYALDSYFITDLGLAWSLSSWDFAAKVKNLLNEEYYLYSGYAMPGRNYQLSIQYKLKFKK